MRVLILATLMSLSLFFAFGNADAISAFFSKVCWIAGLSFVCFVFIKKVIA